MSFSSASPEETRALGEALGRVLQDGDFVGLVGDLGAGKTELARGIARGVGLRDEDVTSPTFAIVHQHHGRIVLTHADLYRITGPTFQDIPAQNKFPGISRASVRVLFPGSMTVLLSNKKFGISV